MLGEIFKPASPSENKLTDLKLKGTYKKKLMKWFMITDSVRGAIRTICTIDPMSHVGDIKLASDIWMKSEFLYRDTGFIERNAIFIRLSA